MTYMTAFMEHYTRRKYSSFAHNHIAGYLHRVANHALVGDARIVAYMAGCEDKGVGTDHCSTGIGNTTVDNHILANNGVSAYSTMRLTAFPAEVLRVGTHNRALVHFHIPAKCGSGHYGGIRHNLTAVADYGIGIDICKGMDFHVLAKLCFGIDVC